jgi:hypothetical protein
VPFVSIFSEIKTNFTTPPLSLAREENPVVYVVGVRWQVTSGGKKRKDGGKIFRCGDAPPESRRRRD